MMENEIKVAVLLTCFNRKQKTLSCLNDIFNQSKDKNILISIYIVDGGSTDGTLDAVHKEYPDVITKYEEGLYWAGGMRAAWNIACKKTDYDYYWLVNDDTRIYKNALSNLIKEDEECAIQYHKHGVIVGSTKDPHTGIRSYGGLKTDGFHIMPIVPDEEISIECDLTNANLLLVSRQVFNDIGGLSERFTHGIADYEYAQRAKRAGYPVLIGRGYYGECVRDHGPLRCPPSTPLKKRIEFLYSPKGLAFNEVTYYLRTYFPKRYVYICINYWTKTLFPFLWKNKK